MKKLCLVVMMLGLGATPLRAQTPLSFEALLGGNSVCLLESDGPDADALLCLAIFFGFCYPVAPNACIIAGLGVDGAGNEMSYSNDGEGFLPLGSGKPGALAKKSQFFSTTRTALNYLNIPLKGRYRIGKGKIVPYIEAGPSLGILLTAKTKTESNFSGQTTKDETDVKDGFNSTNLVMQFGGGLIIPVSSVNATVNFTYLLGLSNIAKSSQFNPEPNVKTRGGRLTVGVMF